MTGGTELQNQNQKPKANDQSQRQRQDQVDAFDRVIAVPAGDVRLLEIGAGRRADRERARDLAVLAWTARFRFVTVGALALRFGVSDQRMRVRVRRLVGEGLVEVLRPSVSYPQAVHLTRAGAYALGLPARAKPGKQLQFAHELAIVKRVIGAEAHFAAHHVPARVLTERELRWVEASTDRRFSVEVLDADHRRRLRWPDYVVEAPEGRTAVELELSPKTTVRLRSMIAGYLRSPAYDFVDLVVLPDAVGERLARRLRRVLEQELAVVRAGRLARLTVDPTRVRVVGWRDPYPRLHSGIYPFLEDLAVAA